MLTLVQKVDQSINVPHNSISIDAVAGDPLGKAKFQVIDTGATIPLQVQQEVIFIDETVALTPSGAVASAFTDTLATNDITTNYTSTNATGGSVATWTYNASTLTITFDAAAGNKVASGTTNTFSHTVTTNSNRLLCVTVDAGATISGVTYAGVALTQLGSKVVSGSEVLSLWYLLAPATGANNVVITASGTTFIVGASVSYYNVAQTSTFGTLASNSGTGTTSTNTVTTTSTNQVVLDLLNNTAGSTNTVGSGQIKREQPASSGVAVGDKAATGSSMTLTWTFTSGNWAQISVAMNPVTATSTLTASGGSKAFLLLNNWTAQNASLSTTMTTSDAGGLVFNEVDAQDFYELVVYDASAPTTPNTLQVYKTVGGTRSTLGASAVIAFTRGTSHTVALSTNNTGGSTTTITVTFDGTLVLTVTDSTSPLGVGGVGLRNDTMSGHSSSIYTAFSATSNDLVTLTTSVPAHNYLNNNNFTFGQGSTTWPTSGTLAAQITFPPSPSSGAAAKATLTFSNNAVGFAQGTQTVGNNTAGGNVTAGPQAAYAVAGQQYCLSGTVSVTTAFVNAYAYLRLIFQDASGATLTSTYSSNITSAGSGRYSVTATAPANTYYVLSGFGGTTTTTTNSGTATFTALQLEPVWFPNLYSYPTPICDFLQSDSVTLPDGTTCRFDRVFAGFIVHLTATYQGTTRIWEVECSAADTLLETSALVNASYANVTDLSIIQGIVNNLPGSPLYAATAPGQTSALALYNKAQCVAGVTISAIQFADATIREVLNTLADITGFIYGVDAYYNVYYYPPYYNQSRYQFSQTPDNVTSFPYYDYSIEYDGTQLINAVRVVGTTYQTTITETFTAGDGTHSQFIVAGSKTAGFYLTHPSGGTQEIPTVVFGGTTQTTILDTGAGFGTSQTMLQYSNTHIGIGTAIASGTSISVTYTYLALAYVQVQSPDSVAKYGRALYSKINDTNLGSNASAVTRGEAELQYYSQARVTLKFKTQKPVQVGQVIVFTSTLDGITNGHYIVQRINAAHLGANEHGQIVNQYELEAGTYVDDFVDFFRNTQKAINRVSHDPTAPIQQVNNLQQDSLSMSDSLNIHT